MAPLPEELGRHGLNRTDQSQSYPKLRKSDLWRRTHGVAPPTLPLDVERTETVRPGPSGSADHTATRRRAYRQHALTLPLDVERTETCVLWCGWPYCSPARPHTATRRRAYRNGTSRPEWQCPPHGTARSGPSGSATHTATRRRAYGLHALTLPLDVERTEDVALTPGDLVHAGVMVLPRVVPGHPCLAGPMTSSGNVPL